MSGDRILRNSPSFVLQFCPRIRRVYQSKFRAISLLIQVPRKTNDREESASLIRCISFFSPCNVVVHWHEDDLVVELLRFTL